MRVAPSVTVEPEANGDPWRPAIEHEAVVLTRPPATVNSEGIVPGQPPDGSTSDLPPNLSAPARRALSGAGITQLAQLIELTVADLSRLHGMGPKTIQQLRLALAARGLKFKNT